MVGKEKRAYGKDCYGDTEKGCGGRAVYVGGGLPMVIKNHQGHSANDQGQGKTDSGTAYDENAAKVRDSRESDAAISWVRESNAWPHREPQEPANKGKRHQSCDVACQKPWGYSGTSRHQSS